MTPTEARMALEREQREQDDALAQRVRFVRIGKHRDVRTLEYKRRDETAPSTIGRHVKVCGDIGPRIGDDGSTRCGRVMHHDGNHHTNPEWSGFNEGWPGAQQGGYDKTDHDYRDHFGGPIIP